MSTKKKDLLFCDFETTILPNSKDSVEVWLWCALRESDEEYFVGDDIQSFVSFIFNYKANHGRGCDLEFFNLKFDMSYLLPELNRRGIEFVEKNPFRGRNTVKSTDTPDVAAQKKEDNKFDNNTMESCIGMVPYQLSIKVKNTIININDTSLYTGRSISFWGKKFNMPKGDTPLLNEKPVVIVQEWIDYIKRDVEIQLLLYRNKKANGLEGMTTAGMAFRNFKEITFQKKTDFRIVYPKVTHGTHNIRSGYRGGYTRLNPKYEGLDLRNVYAYDVVSSYPTQLYYKPLPWGSPIYQKDMPKDCEYKFDENNPHNLDGCLWICRFTVIGHFYEYPTLLINGDYPMELNQDVVLTSVDYYRMKKCGDFIFIPMGMFEVYTPNTNIFRPYIDYWIDKKQKAKAGSVERETAKLMLNSLYGKFGTREDTMARYPYIADGDITKFKAKQEIKEGQYLPVAMFVTAYAREILFEQYDLIGYKNIVYSDTDSIYTIKKMEDKYLGKELGNWEHEITATRATFYRAKTYKCEYEEDGKLKLKVKCAGINSKYFENKTYDEIDLGYNTKHTVTRTKHGKGGMVIYETEYSVKEKQK